MKLHSDNYTWRFGSSETDDSFYVIVEDAKAEKRKIFHFSGSHRYEGIANHMNSLTDDQMKDFLKGAMK
jgi:hypothetical protein